MVFSFIVAIRYIRFETVKSIQMKRNKQNQGNNMLSTLSYRLDARF